MRARGGWDQAWYADYQARQVNRAATAPPFELTPPPVYRAPNRHEEEELQAAIVQVLRPLLIPGARLLGTNGELPGGSEQIPRAGRRKAMGYTRGTADLLARRPGALVWLEIKIPPNKPTPEQEQFGVWARSCGDGWEVVTSVADAGLALKAWGMLR